MHFSDQIRSRNEDLADVTLFIFQTSPFQPSDRSGREEEEEEEEGEEEKDDSLPVVLELFDQPTV